MFSRRIKRERPSGMYDGLKFAKRREPAEPNDTSGLAHKKIHPKRDPEYRKWLRSQPCAIRGLIDSETDQRHVCWSPQTDSFGRPLSDPCHSGKAYSGRLKRNDTECIAICRHGHRQQEDNHARFDRRYGIDRFEIARELFARFEKERGR